MFLFQSHNGAIAAQPYKNKPMSFQGFNPTMVRLLLSRMPSICPPMSFRSHNGAIAARKPRVGCLPTGQVSIPQWCDCCSLSGVGNGLGYEFQSHNGAIAAVVRFHQHPIRNLFQSHNGAIAALHEADDDAAVLKFQSHNGAIAAVA